MASFSSKLERQLGHVFIFGSSLLSKTVFLQDGYILSYMEKKSSAYMSKIIYEEKGIFVGTQERGMPVTRCIRKDPIKSK